MKKKIKKFLTKTELELVCLLLEKDVEFFLRLESWGVHKLPAALQKHYHILKTMHWNTMMSIQDIVWGDDNEKLS